jgi:hypothetical protein
MNFKPISLNIEVFKVLSELEFDAVVDPWLGMLGMPNEVSSLRMAVFFGDSALYVGAEAKFKAATSGIGTFSGRGDYYNFRWIGNHIDVYVSEKDSSVLLMLSVCWERDNKFINHMYHVCSTILRIVPLLAASFSNSSKSKSKSSSNFFAFTSLGRLTP